jgi:hypothetical protein
MQRAMAMPYFDVEEQYEMQHAMATRHLTSHMPQVYFGPEQHMAVQRQWHYQSVMHRADETFGWRSSTQLHFASMPGETGMAMPYFDVEPDMVKPRPTSLLGGREPWLGPGTGRHNIMFASVSSLACSYQNFVQTASVCW